MLITRDEMAAHISSGRAEKWTEPLAGVVPTAARMDGTWYVVLDDQTDGYQPAPGPLADLLTRTQALLATADTAIANTAIADTGRRPPA